MSEAQDPICIFVGSEPRMWRAEKALEYTLRRHCPGNVIIRWMNHALGGEWADWNIGREPGRPASGAGWYTDFSNFRMAIPEVAGFRGLALYLDVDVIVLGDLSELWSAALSRPVLAPLRAPDDPDTSLMLMDCGAFRHLQWWPSLSEMKTNGWRLREYVALLLQQDFFAPMPSAWYSVDGVGFSEETKVLHFSEMRTQPWHPYGDLHVYEPHARPEMALVWWRTYAEALETSIAKAPQCEN
jgi:hypothetical protein